MSDSNNTLNIKIVAKDDASEKIAALQKSIKKLNEEIEYLGSKGIDSSNRYVAALKKVLDADKESLAAIKAQQKGLEEADSAGQKFATTVEVISQRLKTALEASLGPELSREINRADESARVLAKSLSAAAEADSRFRDAELQAAEAIKVKTEAMAKQGAAVKVLSGEQFFGLVNRRMGLGQTSLSARESAGAIERELGPIGLGISTIESAGFNRMVADLAGVKMSLLDAKASGEAFAKAGLTDTEVLLGLSTASIAAAEAQEKLAAATQKALDKMGQQALAAREARESLAIPAAPIPMSEVGPMPGIPSFLSSQKNAAGEAGLFAEEIAAGATVGAAGLGSLNKELGHTISLMDSLARGHKGQAMSTLGAAAKDAGLGVNLLSVTVAGFIAVMAVTKILEKAEELGKWAHEAEAAASATGMTIEAYTGLQAVLRSMGLSGDEADTSLRRLAQTLSQALADPTSMAAQAFHNLGISQQQLVANGQNVAGALNLVANAQVRTADGANKTANMVELLGRGFEHLVPLLQKGEAGLKEATDEQNRLGNVINEKTARALKEEGDAVEKLSDTIRGAGIQSMVAWQPVIVALTNTLGSLGKAAYGVSAAIGRMASDALYASKLVAQAVDIHTYMAKPDNSAASVVRDPKDQTPGPKAAVAPLTPRISPLEAMQGEMADARLKATSGASTVAQARAAAENAELSVMESTLQKRSQLTEKEAAQLEKDIANKKEQMRLANLPSSASSAANDQAEKAALQAGQGVKDPRQQRIAENEAYIQSLQKSAQAAGLEAREREAIEKEITSKTLELQNERTSAEAAASRKGAAEAAKAAKQSYEDFAANERLKISQADGSMAQIKAIYDEWLTAVETRYKQHANVIETIEREKNQAILKAKLQQIKEETGDNEQINKAELTMRQANAIGQKQGQDFTGDKGQDVKPTVGQLSAAAQQVEANAQKLLNALNEKMNTAVAGSSEQKEAAKEIVRVVTESKQQEIALYKQAAEQTSEAVKKMMAPFSKLFDEMGSQFESLSGSFLNAVIAPQVDLIKQGLTTIKVKEGSTEIKAALRKFGLELVDDAAKTIETSASQFAAKQLGSALGITVGEGGGIGSLLSGGLSKLLGIGGAASNGLNASQFGLAATSLTGAGTALNSAAVALTGAATSLGGTAATTGAGGAVAAAGSGGGFLSFLGSLFSFGGGGIVPSAAGGMVVGGTGTTLARLHEQEMVLPKHLSLGIQNMINNGGGGSRGAQANLNYAPTINTNSRSRGGTGMTRAEFSQLMASHGGAMLGEARNMVRNGFRG